MVKQAKKLPFARLRGVRAERGLSLEDMGKICGISEQSYMDRENGKREFKLSDMIKLCDYFGVTADELFFADRVSNMTHKSKVS